MIATGMLILRVVVGLTVAAHGAHKLFGVFLRHGIDGTAGFLDSLGFRPARGHAYLLGSAEALGGLLLALGLLTPLAAAMIIGVMTAPSWVVHRKNGFFVAEGGYEFPMLLAVVVATVVLVGPGRYSIDAALGTNVDGVVPAVAALLVGVLSGVAVVAARWLEQSSWRRAEPQS
jgi:putative oxidoreductase